MGDGGVDVRPAAGTGPAGRYAHVIELDRDPDWTPPEPRPWSTRTRVIAGTLAAAVAAGVYFAGIARPTTLAPAFQRIGIAEAMALDTTRAYVSGNNRVRAYRLSDGGKLWSHRVVGLSTLQTLDGDRLAIATVDVGQRPTVEVLDAATGAVLWKRQTRFVAHAADVLVVSGPLAGDTVPLRGLRIQDGSPRWTVAMDPTTTVAGITGPLRTDQVEVSPGHLRVRDLTSGRIVVDVARASPAATSAAVVGGTALVVDDRDMIDAYDTGDGRWLWRIPSPVYGIFSAFGDCGRYVCHINDRGTVALDRLTRPQRVEGRQALPECAGRRGAHVRRGDLRRIPRTGYGGRRPPQRHRPGRDQPVAGPRRDRRRGAPRLAPRRPATGAARILRRLLRAYPHHRSGRRLGRPAHLRDQPPPRALWQHLRVRRLAALRSRRTPEVPQRKDKVEASARCLQSSHFPCLFLLWSVMNSQSLAAEFANRTSGFWDYMTRESLAEWVLRADVEPQPFGALPTAVPRLPGLIRAINDADAKSLREVALGIAGIVIRTTVPAAAESAGQHWLLTPYANGAERWFRLTVGMCWAAEVSYFDDGRITTAFRMAESPIRRALADGSLRAEDLTKFGIAKRTSDLRTFAEDAIVYHCPDIDGLLWFLDQPPVAEAIRLMNARLVATGQFAWRKSYDPDLADEAWAAAEALSLPDPLDLPVPIPNQAHVWTGAQTRAPADIADLTMNVNEQTGYTGRETPGAFPEWQAVNPAAHEAARDEHDRLLVLLMTRLNEIGIKPFQPTTPRVDLAWRGPDGRLHIAEAKSVLGPTEAHRLRLGLGQILDYRHRLDTDGRPRAYVLVTSLEDRAWHAICAQAGVRLLVANESAAWNLV
ncbi:outer membrane protein assembly factor BamB family protein [Asanoa siamensis]|uniref:Pyrrolo-quinoline quinone repeat domain-containing protein n=1 Tax=Asanoa siamensis TaxID=926357 RepID=A0ABQ4CPJ1_9ACTN|nr:PQQ-binding-like beta-propeller repeat protein [Asanoa siamensis]GIF73215.1 hypothetical protein Asi02nite_27330 [Asanoa siamensis]